MKNEISALWAIGKDSPELYSSLCATLPHLVPQLDRLIDFATSKTLLEAFDDGNVVRPIRHLRAVYARLEPHGVIAIKGTEIVHPNIEGHLQLLRHHRVDYPSRGRSLLSVLEHFPIVEQKIPMATTVAECMQDTHQAELLQIRHLRSFGTFAHAPLPLSVFEWSPSITHRFLEKVYPLLSSRSQEIVHLVSTKGLGCMMYYYPRVPLRVAHLDLEWQLTGLGLQERLDRITDVVSHETIMDTWIENVVKMLVIGLMPGSVESIGIGHCIEAQNAVIDGGFVDLGSIKRFDEIQTQQEFIETLSIVVIDLSNTIRSFILGAQTDAIAEYRNPSLVMLNATARVWQSVMAKLRLYERQKLDPRLAAIVYESSPLTGLLAAFTQLSPEIIATTSHNKKGSKGTSLQ